MGEVAVRGDGPPAGDLEVDPTRGRRRRRAAASRHGAPQAMPLANVGDLHEPSVARWPRAMRSSRGRGGKTPGAPSERARSVARSAPERGQLVRPTAVGTSPRRCACIRGMHARHASPLCSLNAASPDPGRPPPRATPHRPPARRRARVTAAARAARPAVAVGALIVVCRIEAAGHRVRGAARVASGRSAIGLCTGLARNRVAPPRAARNARGRSPGSPT